MKFVSVLLAVSCLLSVLSAQWLETTIPDLPCAEVLCYNSVNNKVYCAINGSSSDILAVIDGATNAVVAQVEVGPQVAQLCYNPVANKVYCSDWYTNSVTVVCGAGDTVIGVIDVQDCMGVMCCDSAGNKMYCAGDTGRLAVVDCAGDSVLRMYSFGGAAKSVACSPHHRRVFCGVDYYSWVDSVFVLDCVTDSIVATVPVYDWPQNQCYNPTNGCIYCLADYENLVTVIDCASNQVAATVYAGYGQSAACCAPGQNKVFCATHDGRLLVIDAGSNTIADSLQTGSFNRLFYNRLDNKVYCVSCWSDSVTVIDAASNSVLRTIGVGDWPADVAWNPVQNRTYVANYDGWSVSVLRDSGGGVSETAKGEGRTAKGGPTIVSASGLKRLASSVIFDATGRGVTVPKSGVYFVVSEPSAAGGGRSAFAVRKVVLQR